MSYQNIQTTTSIANRTIAIECNNQNYPFNHYYIISEIFSNTHFICFERTNSNLSFIIEEINKIDPFFLRK